MRQRDGIRKEKAFEKALIELRNLFPDAYEDSVVRNRDGSVDAQLIIPINRDDYQTRWIDLSHFRFPGGIDTWVSFGTIYRALRQRKRKGMMRSERERSRYLHFSGNRHYYHRGELEGGHSKSVANLWYQLVQLDNDTDFDLVGIGVRITFDRHRPDIDKFPPEYASKPARKHRGKRLRKPPKDRKARKAPSKTRRK